MEPRPRAGASSFKRRLTQGQQSHQINPMQFLFLLTPLTLREILPNLVLNRAL
jgi:hypothetical protein